MNHDFNCPICGNILSIYERPDVQEKLRKDIVLHGVQNEVTGILLKFLFTPKYDPQDCSPEARRGIDMLKRTLAGHVPGDRSDKRVIDPVEVLFLLVVRLLLKLHLEAGVGACHKNHFRCQTALMVLDTTNNRELKAELQDLFFAFLSPSTFEHIRSGLPADHKKMEKSQQMINSRLVSMLKKMKINAKLETRIKSIYSTFRKTKRKNVQPAEVDDLLGFRIVTHSLEECYTVLEALRKRWGSRDQHIQDYIREPKETGYQSIHLHVLIKNIPVEFQIRDKAMHHIAVHGRAAHGGYKLAARED